MPDGRQDDILRTFEAARLWDVWVEDAVQGADPRLTVTSRLRARITGPFGANIRTLGSRNKLAYRDPENGVLTAIA